MSISFQDVLDGAYVFRSGGLLVAIHGYFDDSGTHPGSPVFVWAGWLSTSDRWARVESAWAKTLRDHGIKGRFNMAACASTDTEGEFGNRADRDSLIHDLRQIILENELAGVGIAIVADAWSKGPPWLTGPLRDNPNHAAAAFCVAEVQSLIEKQRTRVAEPIALFFDQGAKAQSIIELMNDSFNELTQRADAVAFLKVADSPGLQAADMIAWELRNDTLNYERYGPDRALRPHFQHFVDRGALTLSVMNSESIAQMWKRGPPPSWRGAF